MQRGERGVEGQDTCDQTGREHAGTPADGLARYHLAAQPGSVSASGPWRRSLHQRMAEEAQHPGTLREWVACDRHPDLRDCAHGAAGATQSTTCLDDISNGGQGHWAKWHGWWYGARAH